jgi:hypothetical protein
MRVHLCQFVAEQSYFLSNKKGYNLQPKPRLYVVGYYTLSGMCLKNKLLNYNTRR